jgi:hypothetical protein
MITRETTQEITQSPSKTIQTKQDVENYALSGPNLSKPYIPLHLRVPDLGDTLPTNSSPQGYLSVSVAVKHRQLPYP